MAYEIYYTSSPEGLRPGDRGFCTVAATPGIPRRLWDRLEALSGYRHHFDTRTRPGANPVSYAHWTLNADGHDYHVLSRVCDAGLDYSQRTNALAHHVALETAELAPGGPAWLLTEPGVMIQRWDGRIGQITRARALPMGDTRPAACTRWQVLAGDAGWAGVLAESIASSPWKPICLLFGEGQNVLPLVAEVLALLPPALRWQATFNTYFTSLPGGVNCQWRCCLAGTPAAASAIRWAGNGLIIDLTQPAAMGKPPQTAGVLAARNGQMLAGPRPAPLGVTPRKKPVAAPTKPVTPPPLPAEPQPIALKPLETAPSPGTTPAPAIDVTPEPVVEAVEEAPAQPEISWGAEVQRSRRRLLLATFAVGLAGVAAGAVLIVWASRSSSNQPLPPVTNPTRTSLPPTPILSVQPTPTVVVPPPATTVVAVPNPTTVAVPDPTPVPTVTTVTPRPAPVTITLASPLPPAGAGGGVRDVVKTLAVPAAAFDDLVGITSVALAFPQQQREFAFKSGELEGMFVAVADGTESRPGVLLQWRDAASAGNSAPIVSVSLDRARSQLEFTWRTSVLLRRPELAGLGYWVLQNSALVVSGKDNQRPQRIEFGPIVLKPTSLTDAQLDVRMPGDLPAAEQLSLGASTPAGWHGTAGTDPANPAPGENVVHTLRLEKPPAKAGILPRFTIRFSASARVLETDLKKVMAAARDSIAPAEEELQKAEDAVRVLRESFEPGAKDLQQRLAEWKEAKVRAARAPRPDDLQPAEYEAQIDLIKKALADNQAELDRELAPLLTARNEAAARSSAWRETLAAYEQLKEIEVAVDLPQGLHVATVRLARD